MLINATSDQLGSDLYIDAETGEVFNAEEYEAQQRSLHLLGFAQGEVQDTFQSVVQGEIHSEGQCETDPSATNNEGTKTTQIERTKPK